MMIPKEKLWWSLNFIQSFTVYTEYFETKHILNLLPFIGTRNLPKQKSERLELRQSRRHPDAA